MLKIMSAEERKASYAKQNPREIKSFTREAAKKIKPGENSPVEMK